MREAALILAVAVVLILLTALRYRRQLRTMLEFWRVVRAMRAGPQKKEVENAETRSRGRLVRCSGCGVWAPEGREIRLGGAAYCSPACIETAAAVRERRS